MPSCPDALRDTTSREAGLTMASYRFSCSWLNMYPLQVNGTSVPTRHMYLVAADCDFVLTPWPSAFLQLRRDGCLFAFSIGNVLNPILPFLPSRLV